MAIIPDEFCGYLTVGVDEFAFFASGHIVTLLPAESDKKKRGEVLQRIRSLNNERAEYLFGVTDTFETALLCVNNFKNDSLGINLNPSIQFAAPIIVKASGNTGFFKSLLTSEWNTFHAISFFGGNINAVCDPRIALAPASNESTEIRSDNGTCGINVRPREDYTRSTELHIDGEPVTLTISISQTDGSTITGDMGSYSLGMLNSYIRFSFKNPQSFSKIERYYLIAHSVIAILTARNNIFFQTDLSQRDSDNRHFQTGVCKINRHYENYATRKRHEVVSMYDIFDAVPALVEKIASKKVDALLALLPEDNRREGLISITNVQDVCTALEVAYDWSRQGKKKEPLIEELKERINQTITELNQSHDEVDVRQVTTIGSAFKYLNYTLKQKILTLYHENHDAVDAVISKWKLPQVTEERIGSFIKLRDGKTHAGSFDWGENGDFYTVLFSLAYACLFRYIGLPDEQIQLALLCIF